MEIQFILGLILGLLLSDVLKNSPLMVLFIGKCVCVAQQIVKFLKWCFKRKIKVLVPKASGGFQLMTLSEGSAIPTEIQHSGNSSYLPIQKASERYVTLPEPNKDLCRSRVASTTEEVPIISY